MGRAWSVEGGRLTTRHPETAQRSSPHRARCLARSLCRKGRTFTSRWTTAGGQFPRTWFSGSTLFPQNRSKSDLPTSHSSQQPSPIAVRPWDAERTAIRCGVRRLRTAVAEFRRSTMRPERTSSNALPPGSSGDAGPSGVAPGEGKPSPSPGSWPSREPPRLRARQGEPGQAVPPPPPTTCRRISPITTQPSTPGRIPLPRFLCPRPRSAPTLGGARSWDASMGKGIGAREWTLSRRQSRPRSGVRSAGGRSLPCGAGGGGAAWARGRTTISASGGKPECHIGSLDQGLEVISGPGSSSQR